MIDRNDITGLILAGGRGSRMGGVDKGLQPHRGAALARHALMRLHPQVGRVAVNANRNLAVYAAMGAPVWPDTLPDHPGPLAGFLTGLARCETRYLATVPCDSPHFPTDLVARLSQALEAADAEIALAATLEPTLEAPRLQIQPVFCLMKVDVLDSLVRFTASGQRRIASWAASLRHVDVRFDAAAAFANANTPDELEALEQQHGG